jgi:hypothetical protein
MPARLWSDFSSVPASTAASSPAPEDDGENEMKVCLLFFLKKKVWRVLKDDAQDVNANADANLAEGDVEGETPFLRGVPVPTAQNATKFKTEDEDASSSPPEEEPAQIEIEQEGELTATQLSRLEHVLERSALYSTILKQQMDDARARHAEERRAALVAQHAANSKKQSSKKRGKGRPAKRRRTVEDSDDEESLPLQSATDEAGEDAKEEPAFPQPALVSGATLKDYQLEGLQWMVGLHEQGISGILGAFLVSSVFQFSEVLYVFFVCGEWGKSVAVEAFLGGLIRARVLSRGASFYFWLFISFFSSPFSSYSY